MKLELPPEQAWEALPAAEWDEAAARHLLRRAGWTARPADVERATAEGLPATLGRLLPADPPAWPKPPEVERAEAELPGLLAKARRAPEGPEKRLARREAREHEQTAMQALRLSWLQAAAREENAARAKWVLFLSDVYVVSAEKVRNPSLVWRHFDTLGRHAFDRAPRLTKAVSRSPAMVMYLDLEENKATAPNENFARELFELFVLGEGRYSETDIKQAARAFTGYRTNPVNGEFRFVRRQHDPGPQTVFGRRVFDGDDVIEAAYAQPAAAEFLPRELARFYLSDQPLPAAHLAALGVRWRNAGFDLHELARTFFGSRLFFAPEFRGNFIKSPLQYYLGLLQDLRLSVPPLPRFALNPLRQMGQSPFQPPNVRGWVGGRNWINSATLAARRQLVAELFAPLHESLLNADEQAALADARRGGAGDFVVSDDWFEPARRPAVDAAKWLATTLLAGDRTETLRAQLDEFLAKRHGIPPLRSAAIALLQTPDYQLC